MPRPAGVSRPALALAAVALALFGIARTTGSGWLIVVLTGIASTVAVAFALPPVALRKVRVDVVAPREGTVGRTSELSLGVQGGSGRPLKLTLLGFEGPWTGVVAPAEGQLPLVPLRRGVFTSVVLELRSAAPLGLVWWRRRLLVELERPFEVGPAPVVTALDAPSGRDDDGSDRGRVAATSADAVKTVREYVAGDPIKLVHWTATARAGELMVKEMEAPVAPVLYLVVDLRNGGDEAVEAAAGRAAGIALAGLAAGLPVTLATAEAAGPRSGPVASASDVNRRLARAVPGPLPTPARGVTPIVIASS